MNDSVSDALTDKEINLLQLLADDKSMEDAASAMGVTYGTVRVHICRVRSKLGADTTIHAVANAIRRGIID